MFRWIHRSLAPQTLTKGVENDIALPRDYFMQRMFAKLTVTYDTGTSVTKSGTIFDLIKNLELQMIGGKVRTILSALTGTDLRYMYKYDKLGLDPAYTDFSTTASLSGATAELYIPLDWRINKADSRESISALDTFNQSSVTLKLTMGSESDIGSGYTFSSIVLNLLTVEFDALGQAVQVVPRYIVGLTKSFDDGSPIDIPTGNLLRRMLLNIPSGVTDIEMKSGADVVLPKSSVSQMQVKDVFEYGLTGGVISGYVMVDFAKVNGLEGTLDLTHAKQGDVKLYLYGTSGSVRFIYDSIAP